MTSSLPAPVPTSSRHVSAMDGTRLFITDYLLDGARAGIVIMHGLGEHGGRYSHVVQFFQSCGLSVRTYDHRGHGQSQGTRGDVPNNEAILQDAKLVIEDFARQIKAVPLLFAHSMGGLFGARLVLGQLTTLRGLILSSPPLALPMNAGQKLLLSVLRTVAPGLGVSNGLSLAGLSRDPAVALAYQNDPLVHGKITARLLLAMLDAIAFCQAQAATLTVPTLMVVAGSDKLVDPSGSKSFFPKLPAQLASMHWYGEAFHELHNDVNAQQVFADERAWLLARGLITSTGG